MLQLWRLDDVETLGVRRTGRNQIGKTTPTPKMPVGPTAIHLGGMNQLRMPAENGLPLDLNTTKSPDVKPIFNPFSSVPIGAIRVLRTGRAQRSGSSEAIRTQ